MNKLEIEYDYDTDLEQVTHSKTMLRQDLEAAIEWYVEDPLQLATNLMVGKR